MNNIKYDSPYQYIRNIELSVLKNSYNIETDVTKMLRDRVYGRIEHCIIDALYKYPYITKHTLSRYLNIVLHDNRRNDYSNIINSLREGYVIYALEYNKTYFYAIPCYVRQLWAKKKNYKVVLPDETAAAVLEYSSLAQWQVALMEGEKLLHNTLYQYRTIAKRKLLLPSYTETIKGRYRYRIFSFCLPKGESSNISAFLQNLSDIWHLMDLSKRKNQINLTIIIVSSLQEADRIKELINIYPAAAGRRIYYALEGNTSEFSGLECLYYYEREDNEYHLKTIDIL